MGQRIHVRVNGVLQSHEVPVGMSLLTYLREVLDLTGAKEGCNEGECGACVVLVDGKAVNSCLVLAVDADGREDQVRAAMAGNLCRCTGYRQILDAIMDAAHVMRTRGEVHQ